MENQTNAFNLLNGIFTGMETKEILTALFKDKIRFHSLKNFSHEERFSKPHLHAQERIPELKKILSDVLDYLEQNGKDNNFEIHADVRMKVIKP